jgi:hypothetical protein
VQNILHGGGGVRSTTTVIVLYLFVGTEIHQNWNLTKLFLKNLHFFTEITYCVVLSVQQLV